MQRKQILTVLNKINNHIPNKDVLAVGGCVRDVILKRPIKDIDAASHYTPEQIKLLLPYKAIDTGIEHGTVTFVIDGEHIEHTTFRKDVSTDGRRATVQFAKTWQEDSFRRDFTINAMYMNNQGFILDAHGGVKDLEDRYIRTVGSAQERIQEDYLRMLRAFRFAYRYDFDISTELQEVMVANVKKLALNVSYERIFSEYKKMFEESGKAPYYFLATAMDIQDYFDVLLAGERHDGGFLGMMRRLFVLEYKGAQQPLDLFPFSREEKKYIQIYRELWDEPFGHDVEVMWKHRTFISTGFGNLDKLINGFQEALEATKHYPTHLQGTEIGEWQKRTFTTILRNNKTTE